MVSDTSTGLPSEYGADACGAATGSRQLPRTTKPVEAPAPHIRTGVQFPPPPKQKKPPLGGFFVVRGIEPELSPLDNRGKFVRKSTLGLPLILGTLRLLHNHLGGLHAVEQIPFKAVDHIDGVSQSKVASESVSCIPE